MTYKMLTMAAAASLLIGGQAFAAPGGGGGPGGGQGQGGAGPASQGGMQLPGADHANPNSGLNTDITVPPTTNPATGVSQGPANASSTGIAHANEHSVLSGSGTGTALTGVTTGMAVFDANGTQVGTVARVAASGNGTINRVFVTVNGRTFSLAPGAFTIDANGNLTTTTDFGG